MKKGRPKKITDEKPSNEILTIDSQENIENQRVINLLNKMRGRASIYTHDEINLMDELYQKVGREGAMCKTCPQSIARAIEIILIHYK